MPTQPFLKTNFSYGGKQFHLEFHINNTETPKSYKVELKIISDTQEKVLTQTKQSFEEAFSLYASVGMLNVSQTINSETINDAIERFKSEPVQTLTLT